jgi:hypothetical protein
MRHDDKEAADRVTATFERTLTHLVQIEGVEVDHALATAHAYILGLITARHGGELAAACARQAADRIEGLPAWRDSTLARAQPQGRA